MEKERLELERIEGEGARAHLKGARADRGGEEGAGGAQGGVASFIRP